MKRALFLVFFMILLAGCPAANKPKRVESIPFELVGTYVIVHVRINDSSELNLVLDSGIRARRANDRSDSYRW